MTRGLALVLVCISVASGQRPKPEAARSASTPATHEKFFDAMVTDAEGRPVRNLDPANFELSQGGQTLKLSSLTWFDTRQHTATSILKPPAATSHEEAGRGTATPAQPKFEFAPADICRNFVLVVDDLDLAPESATRVQKVV